jgi:hypothetical protein
MTCGSETGKNVLYVAFTHFQQLSRCNSVTTPLLNAAEINGGCVIGAVERLGIRQTVDMLMLGNSEMHVAACFKSHSS